MTNTEPDKVRLAHRLSTISESETIAMAKRGRALAAEGKKVISLSFGEPDFFTPDHIKKAAIDAINGNFTFYTPVAGIPDLREAISNKFKRENNLDYATDQIVVSTGAKNSIMNAVLSLVNPGDEVIIPKPFWVSYADMVHLAEGKTVYLETSVETDYKISAAQLEAAITPKTRLFMFSSPNNPSGSVYSREELASLAAVFEKHPDIYIISDEIYEHINFVGKHESIGQFESIFPRVVTVNGVSKAFSMTGWRIGYIGAAKEIAYACEKLQSQFTSGTNAIAQKAAVTALNSSLEPTYAMREAFLKRRDLCLELMKDITGFKLNNPDGAFYLFPDVSSYFGKSTPDGQVIRNSQDFCMYLLNEVYVVTVSGSAFGNDNCIRMSYATGEDNLREAITRIHTALERLK